MKCSNCSQTMTLIRASDHKGEFIRRWICAHCGNRKADQPKESPAVK